MTKHTLPALGYGYEALEPHIDTQTMTIHHSKHHQAYVDNLNAALDKHPSLFDKSLVDLVKELNSVPEDIRGAVRNNGGGHLNHTHFWEVMTPGGASTPSGKLLEAITSTFGSVEALKEAIATAGKTRFGSGWAWLVVDANKALKVVSTANQDNPITDGLTPILGVDVWEHAYYLKFQNRRPDYLTTWFNVVNWDVVARNYEAAL
ncbi:MAG: superoxide dismutase [Erysipelotrichaceae bacterium]|nr:superoxide dismutase [Erysipelotrichaceae bacterium]